jgi:hypothetical protein
MIVGENLAAAWAHPIVAVSGRRGWPFIIGLVVGLASPQWCWGQAGAEDAVTQGREALRGSPEFPWYDPDSDGLQRMDVRPPRDVAARKSKWQPSNAPAYSWPPWLSIVIEVVFWIVLVLALLAVVYTLLRALLITTGDWRSGTGGSSADDLLHGDIDRIESLPFQLKAPQTDLLAQARQHYEAGEFGQAIIYLYSYQLIQLDRHQLIRLTKGKTNRQYLREVLSRRELRELLSRSMIAFEDVFFGHHTLDRQRFESCWSQLDVFHEQLALTAV